MSLGVQSFPELYTTLMGWNLYDQFWDLLSKTGLAFLPFIGIVLRNIAQPYESQETKDAAGTSLRRMEVDIMATLFIIFFGVSPFLPLSPTMLSYTPSCQPSGTNGSGNSVNSTYHPGDTQTTWDRAFTVPSQDIHVPLWWYAVLSVSEGITSAANTMVTCAPDLRKLVTQVDMTQLTDPTLKQEVQQFALNCYIPARTRYLQDTQTNNVSNTNTTNPLAIINKNREQYGVTDTEWLGSHAFQSTYYSELSAQQPVPGFPYQAQNDINADSNKNNPPTYGMPRCDEWWNDSAHGLKNRLYTALPKNFSDEFSSFFANDKNGVLQDDVIKRIINNANTGYQPANNTVSESSYSALTESLGAWFNQLSTYPKLYAAAQAAPIIQALLLLMIYSFLPFALVFSGYKLSTFITGSIIIFSLIFWSFIWHLVSYIDSTLMQALYGNNWFSRQSPNATLADMITGTLIVVAPLFWFSFMGAMGVAVGDITFRAFSSMNSIGEKAASEGGTVAKTTATTAVKLIK